MSNHSYTPFDKFVFRTPRYPLSSIYNWNELIPSFYEDLFIASPELFYELERCQGNLSDKQRNAIYKYWTRACSRSTPFGLFACCSIGSFTKTGISSITISKPEEITRKTRLDMNYLCSIIQYLESLDAVRNQLIYYPNDSLYVIGDKIRYIEYYFKNVKRIHVIQEIDSSEYLLLILDKAKTGLSINEMVSLIISDDITKEDAIDFINELIDSQILKSEIEANVTGDDVLSGVISSLAKKDGLDQIVSTLVDIQNCLNIIDESLIHNEENYDKLIKLLSYFQIKYERNYLLQVDTFRSTSSSSLSLSDIEDIQSAIDFLLNLHVHRRGNKNIRSFTQAFASRYESQEISLLEAMDANVGLGYPLGATQDIAIPLIQGLAIGPTNKSNINLELTEEEIIILRKYIQEQENGIPEEITLDDDDIKQNKKNIKNHLPATTAALCQILSSENKKIIVLKSVGSATAANLLGRFCYLNKDIHKLVCDICDFEQQLVGQDNIVCEIDHLPSSRIGNISSRPILRQKEIHYLVRPGMSRTNAIPASDIVLAIKNGELILKSKTTDETLIPRLSNAHNYRLNTTPVYQFLCDFQYNNFANIYGINNDSLISLLGYCPRIKYKNVILSPRIWHIEFEKVFDNNWKSFDTKEDNAILEYIRKNRIPSIIVIKEADNNLFFDFNFQFCREIFSKYLQKKKKLIAEEFLSTDKNLFVTDGDKKYCAEFIIPFKVNIDDNN